MTSIVLPNSKIIDRFGRNKNLLFLMDEEPPEEIQVGIRLKIDEQEYLVQDVIAGSRNRFGIQVTKP